MDRMPTVFPDSRINTAGITSALRADNLTHESMSDGTVQSNISWSLFILLPTGLQTPATLVALHVLAGTFLLLLLFLPSTVPRASHRQRGGIPLLVKYSCEYFPLRA